MPCTRYGNIGGYCIWNLCILLVYTLSVKYRVLVLSLVGSDFLIMVSSYSFI